MYRIKLPNFEGPFDLLLYFIKKDEINIHDIPIAQITEKYLSYVRLMKYFDLELAGEFLVMAATLMRIKTLALLPKPESEEEEPVEDPRTELARQLLEYKKYKEAAGKLGEMAESQKYVYYRKMFQLDKQNFSESSEVYYENSTLFDLIRAFKTALDRTRKSGDRIIEIPPVSVDEKKRQILEIVARKKRATFSEIARNESRRNVIAAFLALLDLIKFRLVKARQSEIFDDIIISEYIEEPSYSAIESERQ